MNNVVLRANILGGMNEYILECIGDENIHEIWLKNGVPDDVDEDELMEIAQDENWFRNIVTLFSSLLY